MEIFRGLENLTEVHLETNTLIYIDPKTFPARLTRLDMNDNLITKLGDMSHLINF